MSLTWCTTGVGCSPRTAPPPPLPSHPPVEEGGGGPSSLPTRTSGQVWSTDTMLLQQEQEEEGWLLWPLLASLLINAGTLFSIPCLFQLQSLCSIPHSHSFLYVHHLLLPTCASYPHSHSVSQTHSHPMNDQSLPPSPMQPPTPLVPSPCSPVPVTPLSLLDH